MNNWIVSIQHWLYPLTCLLCGDPGDASRDLCHGCFQSLKRNLPACVQCATLLPETGHSNLLCGHCQQKPPAFDTSHSLYIYGGPCRYLVQQLKYQRNFACARLIGQLMAMQLAEVSEKPEIIIPVPLHRDRYRKRGFNQAGEIAKIVSSHLQIPLNLNSCKRTRNTDPQFGLTAKQRKKNLRKAFEIKNGFSANHIAIIDDVVTTGTTVGELAKALKRSGVKKIQVWSFARA